MRACDVEIGATYQAKVSGKLVPLKILEATGLTSGWLARNLQTNRAIKLRSSRRLRSLLESKPALVTYESEDDYDSKRREIIKAPNGQLLPRWVVNAMKGTWK